MEFLLVALASGGALGGKWGWLLEEKSADPLPRRDTPQRRL